MRRESSTVSSQKRVKSKTFQWATWHGQWQSDRKPSVVSNQKRVISLKGFSEQHHIDSDSHTEKEQINEMAAATK